MKIGIAGLIGSGKSAVARTVAQEGFTVLFADDEAHVLYRENLDVRNQLARTFGGEILTSDGVDRAKLGSMVFQNLEKLKQLESIVHPVLAEHLHSKMMAVNGHVFLEGALLPKWPHLLSMLDQVWLVDASPEIRLRRVVERGLPEMEARRRMAQQESFPRMMHSHLVVIPNEKGLEELQAHVVRLLKEFPSV